MQKNRTDIRRLIVKYMFVISIISLLITFFTNNIGVMVLSIIIFLFCGAYLLISKKEKKLMQEVQNYF